MPVIKRYPNRKLYDTDSKKYITLDGIAQLIRQGEEVQVLDHATGDDLTALTLTLIIFEQEKKRAGFLPRSVLTGLVEAGGEHMSTLRRSLSSPLDLFRHVDEEITRRIRTLVKRGELNEEEGRTLLQKLLAQGQRTNADPQEIDESYVEQKLADLGVPSRDDFRRLETQLELLTSKLEELS
jgi:polyhydroxyalkanoate synthesis repressor PhaR